ncbi:MAG: Methionyl-tRNA formyltransferase [Candidatus Uhrbacteria bacterium GW2011_GWA2_42_220]|nr:MAG: Methionyl-tRNA formyltransferase [Candidatus Uhrbacteria bacterium GW2011_GWA2_42_220]
MLNIVFFGTPEFAKEFLKVLLKDKESGNYSNHPQPLLRKGGGAEICIKAVVCQPDKPVGRKKMITAPEVKVFALENNIPVLQPTNFKNQSIVDELKDLEPDLFVIVAYGKLIPQSILNIPKLGCVNVHPSLLPKYRGPSPIQSAILNQETESGVSIMLIDDKMDHGPILSQEIIKIDERETPESLRQKIINLGGPQLIKTIKAYVQGSIEPQEQDHEQATFCKILTREDGRINWQHSAKAIDAQIRALTPWPGTHTIWKRGEKEQTLKIHKAQISTRDIEPGKAEIEGKQLFIGTKTTALQILELQLEGSTVANAEAFILGHRDIMGI